ncbi:MAG TPA: glycosyltransferase [Thermoanaerobaculia bacterium]|nr:glycosyltransferase [Thermoanaerobaculia bacterium]
MQASLSVIIPTFNTASMTLRCCRAVLADMPANTEVIVVDDGSRDETAELLAREVPAVRVVRLEVNRGFATAANAGGGVAGGRVVVLLNSDAIVERGALGAFVRAFENDPKLGVAGARLLNEDGTPQWSGGQTPTLAWMIGAVSGLGRFAKVFRRMKPSVGDVDWVSGAAMAFRREVWDEVGPLSERFLFYCQDIDFCLEACERGWDVRIVEDARVTHGLGRTIGARNDLKCADLLTWGEARYGRTWARFARVMLATAAALRRLLQSDS